MPSTDGTVSIAPLGDRALLITLGDRIDVAIHRRLRAAAARITALGHDAIVELVPAYTSIVVHYLPWRVAAEGRTPFAEMSRVVTGALRDVGEVRLPPSRLVEVPVTYGGEGGPDLEELAARHSLSPERVVELHAGTEYLVYMVGFVPGFAYLGGLPEELTTPRRSEPRTAVPAGTVGIGGAQTGVYPMVSPGGWNLIGRTAVAMFDPNRDPASLLSIGDRVRFTSVTGSGEA